MIVTFGWHEPAKRSSGQVFLNGNATLFVNLDAEEGEARGRVALAAPLLSNPLP